MTRFKAFFIPVMLLSVILFVQLEYPKIRQEVELRAALQPVYHLSNQLKADIQAAEARAYGLPPRYGPILSSYEAVLKNKQVLEVAPISVTKRLIGPSHRWLSRIALYRRGLPADLLDVDPVGSMRSSLESLRRKVHEASARRDALIEKQTFAALRCLPPRAAEAGVRRGLPPDVVQNGFSICAEQIPVHDPEIRARITYQIEHLLTDIRDSTGTWLKRRLRYGKIVRAVLEEEGVPREFDLLAALESGYDPAALSPAGARGWWQFTKSTAMHSMAVNPREDWTLEVSKFRDDRCDLVLSSRSAARYVKWMREHLGRPGIKASWLLVAAAYNAGFAKTKDRIASYGGLSFWDVKLPPETEVYVPRWIALCIIDSHRSFYDLKIPDVPSMEIDTLYGIRPREDIPIALIAAITDSSEQMVRRFNPALDKNERSFRAGTAAQDVTHTIHVPKGQSTEVMRVLKENGYLGPGAGIARASADSDRIRNQRTRP